MSHWRDYPHRLKDALSGFWSDEAGVSGGEYALLLAIIGVGLAIAATTLGTAISNAVNNTADCINAGLSCSP